MRIGRIVALGAGGALAVVGARKLRQSRAARRSPASTSSALGQVTPQRPIDPETLSPRGDDEPETVLRPVPESA